MLLSWAWEQNGQTFADATQALEMARGCVEHGIKMLRDNPTYAGGDTLSFSSRASCTVLAVQGQGYSDRTLCTVGKSGPTVKRLVVTIGQLLPRTDLFSYKEVGAAPDCSPALQSSSSGSGSSLSSSSS
jgi:hypothetical protein